MLDRATTLDAAVRALALALEAPNEDARFALKGIEYKALRDKHGFTVTLHGLTLFARIRTRAGPIRRMSRSLRTDSSVPAR